jgi:hypothetical protein
MQENSDEFNTPLRSFEDTLCPNAALAKKNDLPPVAQALVKHDEKQNAMLCQRSLAKLSHLA